MGDYGDAMMRNQNAAVSGRTKAQNRANLLELKSLGQRHPTGLTDNLLKLFEPRPPLEYKPPSEKRKCPPYTGMAQFVSKFAEPGDPEYDAPVQKGETPAERRARIRQVRLEKGARKATEDLEKYDPNNDSNISGDPYKTLFVAKLNYETTESRVKREFEAYGPIKRVGIMEHPGVRPGLLAFGLVSLVTDKESNKPRGYAFIEYVHTRDMKAAYKQADGKKIDNKRVLVDVERGRTVPNWRPRRLGGGIGTSRVGNEEFNPKQLMREQVQSGGISRSEEPRVERDRNREESRDRGKDRERERERSHDRPRDHNHRDNKHRRDRDRTKERGRDRDCDNDRDRTHNRDRVWDHGRDRDHHRERERKKDSRDYETVTLDHNYDHGRSRERDRDYEYDDEHIDSKHNKDYGGEKGEHGNQERGQYDEYDDYDRYERMDEDAAGYGYEKDYGRSDRLVSREY